MATFFSFEIQHKLQDKFAMTPDPKRYNFQTWQHCNLQNRYMNEITRKMPVNFDS